MGRHFAIDYAYQRPCPGLVWRDGSEPTKFELPYSKYDPEKAEKARLEFIASLNPDDTIWVEMGPTHRFALACYRQGCQVRRISGHWTKTTREEKNLPKSESVQVLHHLASSQPELFYPYRELDESIAEVGMLAQAFYTAQEIRKRAVQRLGAVQRDLYLVKPTGQVDVEVSVQDELAKLVWFAGVLTEKPKTPLAKLVGDELKGIEQIFYNHLRRRIYRLPVYKGVFRHISNCGPAMSAVIIWRMADVDFFPSEAKLKHYAGLHQLGDGACPRRKKGEQSDWDARLKQPFYLFARQVRVHAKTDDPWRIAWESRLAYEASRTLPEDEEIVAQASNRLLWEVQHRRASRWLGQKLAEHIWRRWKVFKAGGEYQPPNLQPRAALVEA